MRNNLFLQENQHFHTQRSTFILKGRGDTIELERATCSNATLYPICPIGECSFPKKYLGEGFRWGIGKAIKTLSVLRLQGKEWLPVCCQTDDTHRRAARMSKQGGTPGHLCATLHPEKFCQSCCFYSTLLRIKQTNKKNPRYSMCYIIKMAHLLLQNDHEHEPH